MSLLPQKFNIRFMNLGYAVRPYGVKKGQRLTSTAENMKIAQILEDAIEPNDAIRAHVYLAHPEIQSIIGIDKVVADQTQNQLIVGSANNLPLPSSSLDLILNIESSHLYDSTPQFLAEVFRVLKPGGYFCWADIRFKEEVPVVLEEATATGLKLVEYENITSGVLNGIEYTSRQYDKLFDKAPWIFRLFKKSIRTTYCAPGTWTYNRLLRREKLYAAACWTKPTND
uniref:Methyltransferase type 11 domain-containing protein n=1 Tax=Panagrolaimus sp. JU765 TaxID=591449 RepID=A0AC34R3A4_9BILA